jgi:hypothetical protein
MAEERHGNGMGAAWARYAMCESALTLLHLCAVRACYWETFALGSAPLLAVGFVMRVACLVVRLVVSRFT